MHGVQPSRSDFLHLHNAEPAGPTIGFYGNEAIAESVIDQFGKTYTYVGLAPRSWNGKLDGEALGKGEFLFRSGLVYRLKSVRISWFERLFAR